MRGGDSNSSDSENDCLFVPIRRQADDGDGGGRKDIVVPLASRVDARVDGVSYACVYEGCAMRFTHARWRDVHENEVHSPFFNGRFACLVCDKTFKNDKKRYFHLVEKHAFPRDFVLNRAPRIRPRQGAKRPEGGEGGGKQAKLCRYVKAGEACPRGGECWFAHDRAQLVPDEVGFGRRGGAPLFRPAASEMDTGE